MRHGRQSGLEPFKTVQQTGLHPTAPAFIAWQNFSQVIKTGICRPIGTHTRKRHLQTAFVHARLGRQLTCLRHLSFDLSWVLPGSSVSRVGILSSIASHKVYYIRSVCLPSRYSSTITRRVWIFGWCTLFRYSMLQRSECGIERPHLPTLLSLPQTHAANAIKFSSACS